MRPIDAESVKATVGISFGGSCRDRTIGSAQTEKGETMSFKKRYILAEEAEERIVSLSRKERNDAADIFNTAIDACQSIILDMYDNAPDVVEVVRCKDCRHRPFIDEDGCVWAPSWDDETCPCLCEDCYYNWMPDEDFFCGKGERRNDATD